MLERPLRRIALAIAVLAIAFPLYADNTPQTLPFSQNWSNTSLITTNDDWSGVPGITGYLGDASGTTTNIDPRTILDERTTTVDVIANQSAATSTAGGVAEIDGIADPVVALQGSGTADSPFLLISIVTTGKSSIRVSYNVRDVDGTGDNATQQVALQYRVGTSGSFTNLAGGYIADATTGPSLATLVTPISVTLPAAADDQAVVQIRVITSNASGSDEWVGIDDIYIDEASNPSGTGAANPTTVNAGNSTLLTVAVSPGASPVSTGLAVEVDLSSIGGSATQALYDDGTNGDVSSGDNTFSFNATVDSGTSPGPKSLAFAISDDQARSASGSIDIAVTVPAPTPHLTISQVYGGGGNSGAPLDHDFIELYNPSSTTFYFAGDWSVQYASSSGSSWQVTPLIGFIHPGGHFLIQENGGSNGVPLPQADVYGSISMSASSGKIALVSSTTALSGSCPSSASIVDFVGYGSANCYEGTAAAPGLSNTTADIRGDASAGSPVADGSWDTDVNVDDFFKSSPDPHNSGKPEGDGVAIPSCVPAGGTTLLTVIVTPGYTPASTGLLVTGDLTSIGGSALQLFYDDGTHGDVTSGDNTFSFETAIGGGLSVGQYTVPIAIIDDQLRTATSSIVVTVPESTITPIHDIQGPGLTSPLVGNTVTTEGIVTAIRSNGFFIQTPDADVDDPNDPNTPDAASTSEGIFVFTSTLPDVSIGDYLQVTGDVQEYVPSSDPVSPPITELSNYATWCAFSFDNPLPAPVEITAPDTDPAGSIEQLERYEGMRVTVGSMTVVHPTEGYVDEADATSTSNGVFYGVVTGVGRPFREPGIASLDPLPGGSPCCVPRFDENPERLRVDSDALVGASAIDVAAGATITDLTGVLDFAYRTWNILPDPNSPHAVTDTVAATPVREPTSGEFTVASFNLERFYDDVDDPGVGDAILTTTAYDNRLAKASMAIRNVLRAPDILAVVEMENLSTLQALATKISTDAIANSQPDPQYVAYLEEGNDVGGIDVGFLVKAERVSVISVTQVGKDATYYNPVDMTDDTLYDRPPLVLEAEVIPPFGDPFPITVIANHIRSLSGIDDPTDGPRVRAKRNAEGEYLASYVAGRLASAPLERIALVGDFNDFQFSDGYVFVVGAVEGNPPDPNEVVLASADNIDPNLIDLVDSVGATQRYSFIFDGSAQVLDHVIVTPSLDDWSSGLEFARVDADFPEVYRSDAGRPERVSDHDAAVAYFRFPVDISMTKSVDGQFGAFGTVVYTIVITNNGAGIQPDNAGNEFEDQLSPLLELLSWDADSGTIDGNTATGLVTWNGSIAGGSTVTITITARVTSLANGGTIENQATFNEDENGDGSGDFAVLSAPSAGGSGPTSFAVTAGIPSLSGLGLALMALGLALAGFVAMRR